MPELGGAVDPAIDTIELGLVEASAPRISPKRLLTTVLLDTTSVPTGYLLLLVPYPIIVWGADELRRLLVRQRGDQAGP